MESSSYQESEEGEVEAKRGSLKLEDYGKGKKG